MQSFNMTLNVFQINDSLHSNTLLWVDCQFKSGMNWWPFRCWCLAESHQTYSNGVSSLNRTPPPHPTPTVNWPLWPPAWDCYHCSFQELVLRRLPQTPRGPEPCKTNKGTIKTKLKKDTKKEHLIQAVPQKSYVFTWNFLEVVKRGRLAREAVIGVIVRHDGGRTDLAEFVLGTVQATPDGVQVVLPAVPH